ncbi:MAG: hypothetical protein A2341_02405 [Deltaproteobacteria bacterium RIFOXYB12_FULL_58_9]|nr:MAG: hypothetical protein A2341_02405 [Deltaproteobacteria bacterium RIFOXYB12_FULL_58_9]
MTLAVFLFVATAACGSKNGGPTKIPTGGDYVGGDSNNQPHCGNRIIEGLEVCDLDNLAEETCSSQGSAGTGLTCAADCMSFNTSLCSTTSVCGNSRIDGNERCDGTLLDGETCGSLGFSGGLLRCADGCMAFDTSMCTVSSQCGNNTREGGEVCDGTDLADNSCLDFDFDGGTLACKRDCGGFNFDACVGQNECGNNTLEPPEVCDGSRLDNKTCRSLGYSAGILGCNSDCMAFDTTACTTDAVCGDDTVEGPELCDGMDLADKSCSDFGFTGGRLDCAANCLSFVTHGCTAIDCGNNTIEPGELCDGTALGRETCATQGFIQGNLACAANCLGFNTTGCSGTAVCGDDNAEGRELCDGEDLAGQSCVSLGFRSGTLACNPECTGFDTTACVGEQRTCGNEVADGLEICDGDDWAAGPDCSAFGMGTGVATCSAACTPLFTNCQVTDLCAAQNWYDDGVCDACELLGGTVDGDCTRLCNQADGECAEYFDSLTNVWTCQHLGLHDPDCGDCGNNAVEGAELCDGTDPGQYLCEDYGYVGGDIGCKDDCTPNFTTCVPPICGDDAAEGWEPCDGVDVRGYGCEDAGFSGGELRCLPGCEYFDFSACTESQCNNGSLETGELCDGALLDGYGCDVLGLGGTGLACAAGCAKLDVTACSAAPVIGTCGDGILNGLELCEDDEFAFGTDACADSDLGDGTLTCVGCMPSFAGCATADFCAAQEYYNDGYCDACELLGGTVDPDCTDLCGVADGVCVEYFDSAVNAWTCRHLGLVDPDCGRCGNDIMEASEICDGDDSGGYGCVDFGFTGGELGCRADCTPDFSACTATTCGSNTVEGEEVCDGTDLKDVTCQILGFSGGDLGCAEDCSAYDLSNCTSVGCGNDEIEPGELCDGVDLGGQSCSALGFSGGDLACSGGCDAFVTDGCTGVSLCGDGIRNGDEICDGDEWYVGPDCESFNMGAGTAACTIGCTADFSDCDISDLCEANNWYNDDWCDACDLMGGVVDPDCGIVCASDGYCADLFDSITGVWTCQHLGLVDPDCGTCGNNVLEGNEYCDSDQLGGESCEAWGFSDGTLDCAADCTLNFNGCGVVQCGNDQIEAGELCDGTAVNGLTCVDFGFGNGTVICDSSCDGYNTAGCFGAIATSCGDGIANGLEFCDGDDWLVDSSCAGLDLGTGTIGCTETCTLDLTTCSEPDFCAAQGWYGDGFCDACELMGGSVDADCYDLCEVSDSSCANYFDARVHVWTCGHLGLEDPDCGTCGNNILEGGEICDSGQIDDLTCTDFYFGSGNLSCTSTCVPDFTACASATCGDNNAEGGEICDGTDLSGITCQDLGYVSGTPTCLEDCNGFDESTCSNGEWACNSDYYGTDDGCDCGCGVADPDCADATVDSCRFCGNDGSCGRLDCSNINPTNNAVCAQDTGEWLCPLSYYGSDDGCDCGCGIVDPDCNDATAASCVYCDWEGSCGMDDCSNIAADDSSVCAWTCDPDFYGTDDGCDCGCGIVDPDCTDATSTSCDWCNWIGSCGTSDCSTIDDSNNSICD